MRLQDHVCTTLRDDILACRLLPGAELREQALAARLGVSKSPVREALLCLAQERLVAVRPRQGYHVAPVSLAEAADVLELRRVLEVACVRATAVRATGCEREAIERASHYDGRADGFIAYNRAFHICLAEGCGNARLAQAAASAIAHSDRFVHLSLGMIENRDPLQLVAEHVELAASVVAGDSRTAARHIKSHLQAAERRVLKALGTLAKAAASGVTARGTSTWTNRPTD